MCTVTLNQCFRATKKNVLIFYLKMNILTVVKYCYILHGRVCVMTSLEFQCKVSTNLIAIGALAV